MFNPPEDDCANAPLAYTIDEASAVTSLARTTLYDLMKSGTLPYRTVAGRRRLLRRDLLTLLTSA
jgi:excisionase family DNA binding protein